MNAFIQREYARLRARFVPAQYAIRIARIEDAWRDAEDAGLVRLRWEPDTSADIDNIVPEGLNDRERKEYLEYLDREGVYGCITEARDAKGEWHVAESVWGFVGADDADTIDLKKGALALLDSLRGVEAAELANRGTYAGTGP